MIKIVSTKINAKKMHLKKIRCISYFLVYVLFKGLHTGNSSVFELTFFIRIANRKSRLNS